MFTFQSLCVTDRGVAPASGLRPHSLVSSSSGTLGLFTAHDSLSLICFGTFSAEEVISKGTDPLERRALLAVVYSEHRLLGDLCALDAALVLTGAGAHQAEMPHFLLRRPFDRCCRLVCCCCNRRSELFHIHWMSL